MFYKFCGKSLILKTICPSSMLVYLEKSCYGPWAYFSSNKEKCRGRDSNTKLPVLF